MGFAGAVASGTSDGCGHFETLPDEIHSFLEHWVANHFSDLFEGGDPGPFLLMVMC